MAQYNIPRFSRPSLLSTEPQAKKILEGLGNKPAKAPDNRKILPPPKPTATLPREVQKGLQKTPEQGRRELEALRRKHNKN